MIEEHRRLARAGKVAASAAMLAALAMSFPATAHADDAVKECTASYESAQVHRKHGELKASKADLAICSNEKCPGFVRSDCVTWYSEVVLAIPTVVITARSERGDELDVRVTMDGNVVAERLTGAPLEVDPGPHKFHFEHAGKTVDQTFLVAAGAKNRALSVSFVPPEENLPPGSRPTPPKPPSPIPIYVFAGLTLVGGAGFAYFGLTGISSKNNLASTCAPFCTSSQTSDATTKFLLADVSLGVGIVSLGLATYFFATRNGGAASANKSLAVDVEPTRGGGSLTLLGAF